ncbi:hypothetical protein HGRIS_006079 [Hohenbuehelia grisea]|uniref:Zn(2)-C6 fungal-type domain-containing protein n=1 Tax=Hohenbuehelia grisea TaxID=104357 RepID=A0ABR3JYQ9_9AGAR
MESQNNSNSDSELPPSLQRHIIRGEHPAYDPRTRPEDPARRDRDISLPPLPRPVLHHVPSSSAPSSYAPPVPSTYLPPPGQYPPGPPHSLPGSLPPPLALASRSYAPMQGSPIHSDPIYHASRLQPPQSMVRSSSQDSPPLPTLGPPRGEPYHYSAWQEGEPGPSSQPYVYHRGSSEGVSELRLPRITGSPPPPARHHMQATHQLPPLEFPTARRSYPPPLVALDPPATSTQVWINQSYGGSSSAQRFDTPPQQSFTHTFSLGMSVPPSAPHSDSGHSSSRTPDIGGEGEGSRDRTSTARNPRGPRKTEVACNFCRGRKLRCDGGRPSCYNCTSRNKECHYEPQPRRRGPGRAPRGSRVRRRDPDTRASSSQVEDSPSPYAPVSETTQHTSEYDYDDEDGDSDKGGTGGLSG